LIIGTSGYQRKPGQS